MCLFRLAPSLAEQLQCLHLDTNEKKTVEDDSFSAAACDVISSTNTLIANLRPEMASRNSLVAPKQIPRQKPKSGKFWKPERSAFR